jgi:hypothetical protein
MTTVTTQNIVSYFDRLGPEMSRGRLVASFDALVAQQNEQLERGDQPSPIPLAWVALAEWVGLTVDLRTGLIMDGPKEPVRGML